MRKMKKKVADGLNPQPFEPFLILRSDPRNFLNRGGEIHGAPGRNRTYSLQVRNLMFCPLNYGRDNTLLN